MSDNIQGDEFSLPIEDDELPAAAHCIATVLSSVSGVTILGMMLISVCDVTMRKLFGAGVPGSVELIEVVLVAAVFFGMAGAEADRSHVRTSILVGSLSPRMRGMAHTIGFSLLSLWLCWLTYLTIFEAIRSVSVLEYRFGVYSVPVWPAKVMIPIGLAMLILVYLLRTIFAARRALSPANSSAES